MTNFHSSQLEDGLPIPIARCLVAYIGFGRSLVIQRTDSQFAPSPSNAVSPAIRVGGRSHKRLVPFSTNFQDARDVDQHRPRRPFESSALALVIGPPAAGKRSIDFGREPFLPSMTFPRRYFPTGAKRTNEMELAACRPTHPPTPTAT